MENQFVLAAFQYIAQDKCYWNKWFSDEAWIVVIKHTINIPSNIELTMCKLNSVISRNKVFKCINLLQTSLPNALGIHISLFRCRTNGKVRGLTGYYTTNPNTILTKQPSQSTEWIEKGMVHIFFRRSTWKSTLKRNYFESAQHHHSSTANKKTTIATISNWYNKICGQ